MSDPSRYFGFSGERLRWVEQAIQTTAKWMKEARGDAFVDIAFSRPGESDYDAATDQGLAVRKAEITLTALEAEKESIVAAQALFRRDLQAGKYEDER